MMASKPDVKAKLFDIFKDVEAVVDAFDRGGYRLYLVGGSVRDAVLGNQSNSTADKVGQGEVLESSETLAKADYDFTTDALPDVTENLLAPLAQALWLVGKRFGTVSAQVGDFVLEVTTHRGDSYAPDSRKPEVVMGTSLQGDLLRRDFRMNAMAVEFTGDRSLEIIDPFDGFGDLQAGLIRTPGEPTDSFSDDPLRMMRAARFAACFDFKVDDPLCKAMTVMAQRISIISRERIRDELDKLLLAARPSIGLRILVETGLANEFLPELPALALEQDPIHHHKDVLEHTYSVVDKTASILELRLAALFHDVGKPATRRIEPAGVSFHNHDKVGAKMTRRRLRELKYSSATVAAVSRLVYLHLRFHTYQAGWTDRAVRRYVVEAGDLLENLNDLTLADCTTRNINKVRALEARMVELRERIIDLRAREEVDSIRPELDGTEVMEFLGLSPSREVGVALNFLLNLRLDEGILGKQEAQRRLKEFWDNR